MRPHSSRTVSGFADELGRLPTHSIGALVRRGLAKRASGLGAFHEEAAPLAPEVRPGDASTRLPDASPAPSQIRAGMLGGVTPAAEPIDRERFNRPWGHSPR